MVKARVWIALGSNLGDRGANLVAACDHLARTMTVTARSAVYDSEPWGYTDQPRFFNAVIAGWTRMDPLEMLRSLKEIEAGMGRTTTFQYGPRPIDLDLLAYDREGAWVLHSAGLVLPHPRMGDRLFVIQPFHDIDPDWEHPVTRKTVRQNRDELIRTVADSIRRVAQPIPGWS